MDRVGIFSKITAGSQAANDVFLLTIFRKECDPEIGVDGLIFGDLTNNQLDITGILYGIWNAIWMGCLWNNGSYPWVSSILAGSGKTRTDINIYIYTHVYGKNESKRRIFQKTMFDYRRLDDLRFAECIIWFFWKIVPHYSIYRYWSLFVGHLKQIQVILGWIGEFFLDHAKLSKTSMDDFFDRWISFLVDYIATWLSKINHFYNSEDKSRPDIASTQISFSQDWMQDRNLGQPLG